MSIIKKSGLVAVAAFAIMGSTAGTALAYDGDITKDNGDVVAGGDVNVGIDNTGPDLDWRAHVLSNICGNHETKAAHWSNPKSINWTKCANKDKKDRH